jgi:DNA-binding MarR family transcriptional regulator
MRARQLLHEEASAVAASAGLHAAELNVIDILGKSGSISMGQLARETFISPSNTTSTVKKLERAKLVIRKRANHSGREVQVALTAKGRTVFRKCYPAILGNVHGRMAERLSRKERVILAGLLNKLVA